MSRLPRNLWVFQIVAVLGQAADAIVRWCLNPRCPWCGQRTRDLETHSHIDHAHQPGGRP
jgi:hypothetical protein